MPFKKYVNKRVSAKVCTACKTLHCWIPHAVADQARQLSLYSEEQHENSSSQAITNQTQTNGEEVQDTQMHHGL